MMVDAESLLRRLRREFDNYSHRAFNLRDKNDIKRSDELLDIAYGIHVCIAIVKDEIIALRAGSLDSGLL